MKKKITQVLVLAMVICTTTAFAGKNEDKLNKSVQAEFSQKFSGASEVKWSATENYIKASFQLDGQFMAAYFTSKGELLGIARNLASNQLPISLYSGLAKNLSTSWISELFEYATNGETSYYVTLENADQKIMKKSVDSEWTL